MIFYEPFCSEDSLEQELKIVLILVEHYGKNANKGGYSILPWILIEA